MNQLIASTLIIFLTTYGIQSQDLYNNLIISSEDSIKFNISINGFQQNTDAYNNIKITHIYDQSISIELTTVDTVKQIIKKQIYFEKKEMETSAKIIYQDNQFKFRFIGEVNLDQSAIDSTQMIISYHENKLAISKINQNNRIDSLVITSDTNQITDDSTRISAINLTYTGKTGCNQLSGSINSISTSLDNEIFSDQKMKLAKNGIQKNCFLTSDIKKIIEKFEFEDQRLELAKFAYSYTYDIGNYTEIIQLLDFDSSKNSLKNYIEQQ